MLRCLLLGLWCVPLTATPITFHFEGTWTKVISEEILFTAPQVGDTFGGSFTFERRPDGSLEGELLFRLDSLIFRPLYIAENQDGWGFLSAITDEAACRSPLWGDLPCRVLLAFRGPSQTGGGDGTANQVFLLMAEHGNGRHSVAGSSNVRLDPYLPFSVRDAYFVPEPASILLVGAGLLLLTVKWNRLGALAVRCILVGAVAGAAGVLLAVWRML